MVPILFAPSATSFTTNGIGRLSDSQKCKVTEELNGQYELELQYPMGAKYFSDIVYSAIIVAKPFQNGKLQAFRVYKISKPMKGQVKVYARHVSYQLNYIPCSSFSGQTAKQVMENIPTAVAEYCPFTFTSDMTNTKPSQSQNLFGFKEGESGTFNGYIDSTTNKLVADENQVIAWIKCDHSKKYAITKLTSRCFTIATALVEPAVDVVCSNKVTDPTQRRIEYTTSATAEYLLVHVYSKSLDGAARYENIMDSITIVSIGTYTWLLYEPKCIRNFLLGEDDDSVQAVYGGEFEWDNYDIKLLENRGSNKGVVLRYGKNLTDLTQEENIENTITGIYPIWTNEGTVVELPEKVVHAQNANNFPFYRTVIQDFSSELSNQPTEEDLREYANLFIQKEGIGVPEVNLEIKFVNLSDTLEYETIENLQTVNLGDIVKVEFPDLGVSAEQKVTKTEYDVLNERYESITIGNLKKTAATTLEDQMNAISEKIDSQEAQNSIDRATGVMNAGRKGHVIIGRNDDGFANEIYFLDNANAAIAKNVLRINVNGIGFSSNGIRGPYAQAWTLDGHLSLGGINNNHGTLEILDANGQSIGLWDNTGLFVNVGKILAGQFSSKNGEFYVLENDNKVEVGWSGWYVEDGIMKANELRWRTNNTENPSSGTSNSAAINGGCQADDEEDSGDAADGCDEDEGGRSEGSTAGYAGTASFKALWLDDRLFEGGSSVHSYTEDGRSASHLWDVTEFLYMLKEAKENHESRIRAIEHQCPFYSAPCDEDPCNGDGCPEHCSGFEDPGCPGYISCDIEGIE